MLGVDADSVIDSTSLMYRCLKEIAPALCSANGPRANVK